MDIIVNGAAGCIERAHTSEATRVVSALGCLHTSMLPIRHGFMPEVRHVTPAPKLRAGTYRVQDWTNADMGAGIAQVALLGGFGGSDVTSDTFPNRVGPPPPLLPPV
jgi:hypothetical protein